MRDKIHKIIMEYMSDGDEMTPTDKMLLTINKRICALLSEQPEIIRCEDCKHASPNGKYGCKVYHFKQYEVHTMYADDFCSKGERRTDE